MEADDDDRGAAGGDTQVNNNQLLILDDNLANKACKNNKQMTSLSAYITLFTYIPSGVTNAELKFALNTIKSWSKLSPRYIHIVVFVPSLLDVNQLRFVSQEVCDISLTVQTLDKLVLKSHATLRTMFELTYSVINATWYGYADYGTVFDASLHTALRMVWNCQNITNKGNLVFGQSHKLEVSLESKQFEPPVFLSKQFRGFVQKKIVSASIRFLAPSLKLLGRC